MILNILKYPSKILLKPNQKVEVIDEKIKKLISDMAETMYAAEGRGLAAPQVGVNLQIIVVDSGDKSQAFVNPEIIKISKKSEIMEEGCLSLPGIEVKVKRSWQIEVKTLNIEGKEIKFKAEDLLARIIQHEIDHLNGKLILDRANFLIRRKIIKKLTNKI
ncbi:MAG: peptide deformylase [bacterium]